MTEKIQPVTKIPPFKPTLKVEENKPKTVMEHLKEIDDKINMMQGATKKGKVKPFKLKRQVRTKLKRMAKKRKLLVFVLENNRTMHAQIVDTKDGIIVINGVPRRCGDYFTYLYDGKYPCVVLPEWSLEPIGVKDYEMRVGDKIPTPTNARMIYAFSKISEVMAKSQMGSKGWVFIGIGIIVIIYLIFGGSVS